MDPNAALEQMRSLRAEIVEYLDAHSDDEEEDQENAPEFAEYQAKVSELMDVLDGIDEWMKRGGFLPNDWKKNR